MKLVARGQKQGLDDVKDRPKEVVDIDLDADRGGEVDDDLDEASLEADNRIRKELAVCFQEKEKVSLVLVDVFLIALSSIKMKMDRNFSALHKEIEERDLLYMAWPKLEEFVSVCDEVGSRAVTLRLADNRGWDAALQIVDYNDKMIEKYKDCISLFCQTRPVLHLYNWGYRERREDRPFGTHCVELSLLEPTNQRAKIDYTWVGPIKSVFRKSNFSCRKNTSIGCSGLLAAQDLSVTGSYGLAKE
ncbi:929_t:CDS:2 [Racocetra persica]|uniref:929_t:CDS:1 n=1 Tax=Racocetra persica TaxID=160502 RepID=A0ACA9MGI6_9GLOM|nr:929_t:CDS:2 [Racocetra persica]